MIKNLVPYLSLVSFIIYPIKAEDLEQQSVENKLQKHIFSIGLKKSIQYYPNSKTLLERCIKHLDGDRIKGSDSLSSIGLNLLYEYNINQIFSVGVRASAEAYESKGFYIGYDKNDKEILSIFDPSCIAICNDHGLRGIYLNPGIRSTVNLLPFFLKNNIENIKGGIYMDLGLGIDGRFLVFDLQPQGYKNSSGVILKTNDYSIDWGIGGQVVLPFGLGFEIGYKGAYKINGSFFDLDRSFKNRHGKLIEFKDKIADDAIDAQTYIKKTKEELNSDSLSTALEFCLFYNFGLSFL